MARGGGWDASSHAIWPEPFKAAVRALLLSAHRLAQPQGDDVRPRSTAARAARRAARADGTTATLGSLPQDLLLRIAGAAALPMSDWM